MPLSQMHPRVAKEFIAFRKFWNDPVSLWRSSQSLLDTTCEKHEERLQQFLSFTVRLAGREQEASIAQVTDLGLVQEYLRYLENTRGVSHATMGQHISAIISCAKFIIAVPHPLVPTMQDPQLLLTRLRASQASLQRAGEHARQLRRTSQETLSRMLDWNGVIALRQRLFAEVVAGAGSDTAYDNADKAMFLTFLEVRSHSICVG